MCEVKVIMPGHKYELDNIDDHVADIPMNRSRLDFVVRAGDRFPGNGNTSYSGCISQEVIRVLIDRTRYVDNQRRHDNNIRAIQHLRYALIQFETRAAMERGDESAADAIAALDAPELEPTCAECGHIMCNRSHAP